ncbi:head maturation protease [Mycobacterium phage Kumao]|uniref:Capsid maturation protease n=1 Tax=Mycobacterium phage Kumao TaxID=2041344 RepID=A0A2D1GPT3_9CAUD|nr:head maturation protease [Mycobacterium phage Kumao]ATN93978.1 capsid maturation protease [Mycobacterium phage Kumao]
MALKPLDAVATYLALRHAQDQDEIANQLAVALFPLWQIVRFNDLDASVALWLPAALPRIRTAYLQSARVTAVFAQNLRFAELATEEPFPLELPLVEQPQNITPLSFELPELPSIDELLAREEPGPAQTPEPRRPRSERQKPVQVVPEFDVDRVARELLNEASYKTKAQMPGPEQELMHNALVRTSGTAVREAINGSRDVSDNVIRLDRRAVGYARVTDGNPCYFCALLASKGAVYTKDSFKKADAKYKANPRGAKNLPADFIPAKVHNNCRCCLRPVYSKERAMDEEALFYRKQWNELHKRLKNQNLTTKQMVAEFRKVYQPFERQEPDLSEVQAELQERRQSLLDAGFHPGSPQVVWAERTASLIA